MECPHCRVAIAPDFWPSRLLPIVSDEDEKNCIAYSAICPTCNERMIYNKFENRAGFGRLDLITSKEFEKIPGTELLFPKTKKPKQFPPGVPPDYIKDYEEAYRVLNDSSKASAALSRRLLQRLLEAEGNIKKKGNLSKEIEQVINSKQLSKQLSDSIDYIRNIGNFAAHPSKSKRTGEIVEVEPEEAEWNLYLLEQLFDHYFVKPMELKKRHKSLNKKLKKLGKPSMMTSGPQPSNPP